MKMPSLEDLNLLYRAPVTPVMISGQDMFCLLATIQLALRHPGMTGATAEIARAFAEELQKRIVAASPGMKDLCAAGWDPEYDL